MTIEAPSPVFPFTAESPPLRMDPGGVVRVGKGRISIDLVVEQYHNGMTPEDMVRAYDTLVLAEVYSVIAYYLRHRDEVDQYIKRRKTAADALQAKIEAQFPRISRDEIFARHASREESNAPAGQ